MTIAFGEIQPIDKPTPKSTGAAGSLPAPQPVTSSSTVLNPIESPDAWDYCLIQQVRSPGVIPRKGITGHDRDQKFEVKEGKGTQGATETYNGRPPVKFSIKFYLWTAAHFTAWGTFRPLLKYDPLKAPKERAIAIYHPALAENEIADVVVTKIGGLTAEDDNGLYSRTIEFLEYAPPPNANATSTPGATKYTTGKDDPNNGTPGNQPDPAVVALQKQRNALAKQAETVA